MLTHAETSEALEATASQRDEVVSKLDGAVRERDEALRKLDGANQRIRELEARLRLSDKSS